MNGRDGAQGFWGRWRRVLRRRVPLIALCALLLAGGAFALSERQTKQFTATASLVFNNNALNQQAAELPAPSGDAQRAQQSTNVKLVELGETANRTAVLLRDGLTGQQVTESLHVSAQGESNIVNLAATSTVPLIAAEIANVYANQFVAEQQDASHKYFRSVLATVARQLAALSRAQKVSPQGLALQDRAQSLEILAKLPSANVQIAQAATVPSSSSSPNLVRNTILGAVLGLVLGLGLAFLLETFKRRIKKLDDLERIFKLPLLGIIPDSRAYRRNTARKGKKGRVALPADETEVFRTLCARLRYFNVDRDRRLVLVTSAARHDGKTMVVQNLAEVAAAMGNCVLIIESDLRNPSLADRLALRRAPGLAEVLISASTIVDAIQTSSVLCTYNGSTASGGTISVLTAGALPPNPSQLIDSDAMVRMLEWAAENYDLVLLDSPPLSMTSDVTPLLSDVDGVVIVSRRRKDTRDQAYRLRDLLASHQAPVLGVVANGFKARAKVSYQYEYFLGAAGTSAANGHRAPTPKPAPSKTRRS